MLQEFYAYFLHHLNTTLVRNLPTLLVYRSVLRQGAAALLARPATPLTIFHGARALSLSLPEP
jgi:hypothetical protein